MDGNCFCFFTHFHIYFEAILCPKSVCVGAGREIRIEYHPIHPRYTMLPTIQMKSHTYCLFVGAVFRHSPLDGYWGHCDECILLVDANYHLWY